MIESKYEWNINEKEPDDGFFKVAQQKGLDILMSKLLYHRGIKDEEKLTLFLNPDLQNLHDPYLLNDMEKSVKRIKKAIAENEIILVYGDYDADGMTSASIMKETLEMLGAEVQVYLPNRFTDGYGPNLSVYQYFINHQNVSLILTVDNGVSGYDAISYATEHNVDVIVTDHHSMPEILPKAFAIIHPEHQNANYPFKYLAGCGVAFKLACALLESVPMELLDLVAIGTIADMVSLTDENRIMVKMGLDILRQTDRIGLQELLQVSNITPNMISEETVGFTIAPQLNALGRLDDPNPAIELLTGFDEEEIKEIAFEINQKNEERKVLVQKIFDEALSMVDDRKPAQVLAREGWHPGVLGIVAGRLLEKINQPVVLLTIDNDKAKGSARSLDAVNIFEVLNPHRQIFEAFGGHAGAAGMTLDVSQLSTLSDIICQYINDNAIDMTVKSQLLLDDYLELETLDLTFVNKLNQMAPFGMGNPKPTFGLKNFKVIQSKAMGHDAQHLKLKVEQSGTVLDVVAFNQGMLSNEFQQAQHLELAVTLSVNHWNGRTTLQLMLVDARIEGIQLFDYRAKYMELPKDVPVLNVDLANSDQAVLLDLPEQPNDLKKWIKNNNLKVLYFKNNIKHPYYLTGYGTRQQFAKLYKTVYQFPEFDIRYKLNELSHYLKIEPILLVKMIKIFEELDFVTIKDGIMSVNKEAQKRSIEDSMRYQKLKSIVKYQEMMALGTPQEIYDWLVDD